MTNIESGKDFVHQLYESCLCHKGNQAFCVDDTFYTYGQLAARVAAIRSVIRKEPGKTIGLVANDDIDTYASILALWMEGRCYVPLHPLQPLARCIDIIEQVGITVILDSSGNTRYDHQKVIHTASLPETGALTPPTQSLDEEALAYILFTSGSTGRPKGVPVSFGNLKAFIHSFHTLGFQLDKDDRCLQMFDLTFDLSVGSYLLPLLHGSCLYTVKPGKVKWQEAFRLLDEYQLTSVLMVPSVIHYLIPYLDELEAPQLRYSLFCGEALDAKETALWQQAVPNAEVWNVYGPTEDTIYCTAYRVPRTEIKTCNGIVSIGKPMQEVHTLIVTPGLKETPKGQKGELCLAGRQLTPGYWNNDAKNEEAFFRHNGERWYLTGDICAMDEDGDLLYYGRKDSQVKIQGYRIELSEIEYVARRFYKDKVAVVAVPVKDAHDNTVIALAAETEDDPRADQLIDMLKQYLPAYMVPSSVVCMPQFPQNANNKIDRKTIKQLIEQ